MTVSPDETQGRPVEVTCPGCFYPRKQDATAACPICKYWPRADRSGALLPVGTQLKRYVIGEKLGQGGFGITYRGFDLKLQMKVAIKEYYPSDFVGRSTDRKTVVLNSRKHKELFDYGLKTFLKEARTLAQMKHPHLVRVLNCFEMNETAYLVLDYLEGEELTAYLKQQPGGRLPWRQAINLLLPVLDGLQEVHDAGFMHRDLKPGNFFLTGRDRLILLDFGAARQVSSDHASSLLVYSDGYAPYEQYLKDYLTRQGPWTDVYGVAATLYFMLTAQRPPSGLDRKQNVLLNKPDLLKPARYFVPGLPPAFDSLVLSRALAIEPEQRPRSIEKFKQQLEAVLVAEEKRLVETPSTPSFESIPSSKPRMEPRRSAKIGTRVRSAKIGTRVRRPIGPNLQAAVFAMVVTALAWGGWWIWFKPPPESPNPSVVAPLEATTLPAPTEPQVDAMPSGAVAPPAPPVTRSVPVVATPPVASLTPWVTPPAVTLLPDAAPPVPQPVTLLPDVTPPLPDMVRIPGGCFQMGSPKSELGRGNDEAQHRVCVKDFEIGKYEVTQRQWREVMGDDTSVLEGYRYQGESYPVAGVSWDDVQRYLTKLNQETGKTYRLPTEAEWERACRGGVAGQIYCGGNDVDRVAWYGENNSDGWGTEGTRPVAQKAANGFGLYDMSGNVWELTCSQHEGEYSGGEQKCANSGTVAHAARGGSWHYFPAWVRSAVRLWVAPTERINDLGFRLARSL